MIERPQALTMQFHRAHYSAPWSAPWLAAWLLALVCVSASGGCAEAPRLTAESARVRLMTTWVEDLSRAYERQDREALMRLLPPSPAPLATELASVDQVHVRLMVDRIVLDPQVATLSLHWEGAGRRRADAALTRSRGEATIRFTAEGPLTALGFSGGLPFFVSPATSR